MELEVQKFIKSHPSDWEKSLSEAPYCISTSRREFGGRMLVMLKYSQFDSDFSLPLVRECRGIVLDEGDGFRVVSYAFDKFGNYGEPYCPRIDFGSAFVTEKCDGSLMKIVRNQDGGFLISTNGTINAFDAGISGVLGCPFKSFGEVFKHVLDERVAMYGDRLLKNIEEGYTYMFEMVSPWTRVVVPYKTENLYLIGVRNNETFAEERFDEHPLAEFFDTPKAFRFRTFEECVASAKSLPWDDEGYVVMDGRFNRVKVKSPAWLAVHHLSNNHVLSRSRAFDLVRRNETAEVLCYFPDLGEAFDGCHREFLSLVMDDQAAWDDFKSAGLLGAARKDQAAFILGRFRAKSCGFAILDGKAASAEEFYRNCPLASLMDLVGKG